MYDKRKILWGALLVVVVVAVAWYLFWPNRPIARVGGTVVTTGTVGDYVGILRAYQDPGATKPTKRDAFRKVLVDQQIAYVYQQLGGTELTHEQLIDIVRTINKESLAPSVLGRVQYALGGPESESYLRHYILPAILRSRVYDLLPMPEVLSKEEQEAQLQALLTSGAYEGSDRLYPSQLIVPLEGSKLERAETEALRKILLAENAFVEREEPLVIGVRHIAEAPYIVRVERSARESALVTLFGMGAGDKSSQFKRYADAVPATTFDPYYWWLD